MPGTTAVVTYFRYIPAPSTRSRQTSDGYSSTQSQDEAPVLVTFESYSINTQVDGHLSMVVDIGVFVNVFGEKLARSVAREGRRHGHESSQHQMAQSLHIHGVGQGGQVCNWSANMPIASANSHATYSNFFTRYLRQRLPRC